MSKFNPLARRRARRLALQALYQWQFTSHDLIDIEAQFLTHNDMQQTDSSYFHELLHHIPQQLDELQAYLAPFADRPLKEIDPIELNILRIGAYELATRIDIPYRVAINEALELAKTFGAEEGYKYVNGILDKLAQQLRTHEYGHKKG